MANVTIAVVDKNGNPVVGATVLITWTDSLLGSNAGTDNGVTGPQGTVVFSEGLALWPINGQVSVIYNLLNYGQNAISYWNVDLTQQVQISLNPNGAATSLVNFTISNILTALLWVILVVLIIGGIYLLFRAFNVSGFVRSLLARAKATVTRVATTQ